MKIARFTRLAAIRLCCSDCHGYRPGSRPGLGCPERHLHVSVIRAGELPRTLSYGVPNVLGGEFHPLRRGRPVQHKFSKTYLESFLRFSAIKLSKVGRPVFGAGVLISNQSAIALNNFIKRLRIAWRFGGGSNSRIFPFAEERLPNLATEPKLGGDDES